MDNIIAFLQEIYIRFISPSPKFFQIWQIISAIITFITGIPNLLQLMQQQLGVSLTLPNFMTSYEVKIVAFCSGVAWLMSKMTVDVPKKPLPFSQSKS